MPAITAPYDSQLSLSLCLSPSLSLPVCLTSPTHVPRTARSGSVEFARRAASRKALYADTCPALSLPPSFLPLPPSLYIYISPCLLAHSIVSVYYAPVALAPFNQLHSCLHYLPLIRRLSLSLSLSLSLLSLQNTLIYFDTANACA